MTEVVCDASIVLKWFIEEDEDGLADARAILDAHVDGSFLAIVLDLTVYEIGNRLVRSSGWTAAEVAGVLQGLQTLVGVVTPGAAERLLAAELALAHRLTFYDAMYAAVARARVAPLLTADRGLLALDAACTPAAFLRGR